MSLTPTAFTVRITPSFRRQLILACTHAGRRKQANEPFVFSERRSVAFQANHTPVRRS